VVGAGAGRGDREEGLGGERRANMKLAVTAQGPDLESEVDPRFGRAAWFLIVDAETGAWEAVDNSSGVNAASGAGVTAAQTVIDRGASVVITGACGPKASSALGAAGVKVIVDAEGKASGAVKRWMDSERDEVGGS